MSTKEVEVKKCCSQLNCSETAELQQAVAAELDRSDKSLKELLEKQDTNENIESSV